MPALIQIAIDCADPSRLAAFWAAALGYERAAPILGFDPGDDWCRIVDPAKGRAPILFHRVPEPKVGKNRVHLDIVLAPGTSKEDSRPLVDAEVPRLISLGATHVRTDDDDTDYYAVMQDPEGNEFCVG